MTVLENKYISVAEKGGRSYGGSQMLSASKVMRDSGCGVIAALDLLLYLGRFHPEYRSSFFSPSLYGDTLDPAEYDAAARALSKSYLPIIPKFGINGLVLAAGLDLFFIRYSIPYRATWGVGKAKIWQTIEDMLRRDLPVIISVGPNFPLVWGKGRLKFYRALPDGVKKAACEIKAHYVTVTGIDEEWLRVSSWGREYFISRAEYSDYIRQYSGSIVSNIVKLRRVKEK